MAHPQSFAPAPRPSQTLDPEPTARDSDASPPPVARQEATVSFGFPRVATQPPDLTVQIRNTGTTPLPMVAFPNAACFAHFWLGIRVTELGGRALGRRPCEVFDFPGTDKPIAPGESLKVVMPMRDLFPEIGAGDFDIDLRWDPTELRAALGPDAGFDVTSWSVSDTRFTIAKPKKELVIRRGESTALPGGATLQFDGHSHKSVDSDSAPGPLIIGGSFAAPGKPKEEFWVSVFTQDQPVLFDLVTKAGERHTFELVDHVYGESMRLRYFGVLK